MSEAASRVGLVLVSHSRALAEATEALARQMTGERVAIACAAGAGEQGAELGTDATAIAAALERVTGPAGAVVLMDLGSAILSAETAVELVDPELAQRARLVAAPFVEGAIAAAVRAAAGATLEEVAAEARGALAAKAAQLGEAQSSLEPREEDEEPDAIVEVVVADLHGLHVRPAARLIACAARFEATVTVEDLTRRTIPMPATSLTSLTRLGARQGDVLCLRAWGDEAREALEALAAIVREGAAEPEPVVTSAPDRAMPVSPGVAFGPLVRLVRAMPRIPTDEVADVSLELIRLRRAMDEAARAIEAALGGGDILVAHLMLLRDPAITERAFELIKCKRCNAAFAWQRAIDVLAAHYQQLEDPYLRAREVDVRDVGDAVLRVLLGGGEAALPEGPPAVVVAADLAPSEAARLDPTRVLGVIDRRGGPTSHAAILLRAAGIPAVAAAGTLVPQAGGTLVGFDGTTGEVWVDPDAETAAELAERQEESRAARRALAGRGGRVRLACGREIELWANVSGLGDARAAKEAGALGIGLLRTEMLFLDRRDAPSEEEQADLLADIFAVFAGAPMVVRTLDAGGDKALAYLDLEAEANPYLGVRGVRLSLARPALLEAQLCAILVAARGHDVRIMVPMIATVAELAAARAALLRAHEALEARGRPHLWPVPLGIMVEVPAAALTAPQLARHSDFFSIGTNDLTQYTLAAERGHPRLHALADAAHPAVLALVRAVVEAGRAAARPVSVCGEAAGDPCAAALLVGLGVDKLSMGAAALGGVHASLADASFERLSRSAAEALVAEDAEGARAAVTRRA